MYFHELVLHLLTDYLQSWDHFGRFCMQWFLMEVDFVVVLCCFLTGWCNFISYSCSIREFVMKGIFNAIVKASYVIKNGAVLLSRLMVFHFSTPTFIEFPP